MKNNEGVFWFWWSVIFGVFSAFNSITDGLTVLRSVIILGHLCFAAIWFYRLRAKSNC